MKLIGHVDADCFYVSCERIRTPSLKNKPVAVLGNQGACVIAKSYETKKYGIQVGMPVWEAKKLCPDTIFIKRDFQLYSLLSNEMQNILKQYSDVVEHYSIDESFLDFGDYDGDLYSLGKNIQSKIQKKTGIPISIGLSLSRTLAKTASDINKPAGITIVSKANLNGFLQNISVDKIPGIGVRLTERLNKVNIRTGYDYIRTPSGDIKKLLNKPGEELWHELNGNPLYPIRTERPRRKSVSRGGSLCGQLTDKNKIWAFFMRNLERFADALWKQKLETSRVTALLTSKNGKQVKCTIELPDHTNDFFQLKAGLKNAFESIYKSEKSYVMAHIVGDEIRSENNKQLNLLNEDHRLKFNKIITLKKHLNERFGVFAARSATTAYIPEVFKDEASNFEISDLETKFCF